MTKYLRRDQAVGADGIGNWKEIIECLAYFAVPINLSVLLFARDPLETGAN